MFDCLPTCFRVLFNFRLSAQEANLSWTRAEAKWEMFRERREEQLNSAWNQLKDDKKVYIVRESFISAKVCAPLEGSWKMLQRRRRGGEKNFKKASDRRAKPSISRSWVSIWFRKKSTLSTAVGCCRLTRVLSALATHSLIREVELAFISMIRWAIFTNDVDFIWN